eukprot:7390907-Prymnesium_polylepis.1
MSGIRGGEWDAFKRDKAGFASALVRAGSSTCAFGPTDTLPSSCAGQLADVGVERGAGLVTSEGTCSLSASKSATLSTSMATLSTKMRRAFIAP